MSRCNAGNSAPTTGINCSRRRNNNNNKKQGSGKSDFRNSHRSTTKVTCCPHSMKNKGTQNTKAPAKEGVTRSGADNSTKRGKTRFEGESDKR